MELILSIDQGTTGTRSCLFDAKKFTLIGHASLEYPQIYPSPSWVEHNLNDIWDTVRKTITQVMKDCNVEGHMIKAIGITNQRETTCAFNKEGTPLANAIVWQDRRTTDYCRSLDKNIISKIRAITGLPVDPYFSATKMNWLLKNNPVVATAQEKDNLLFGTIDTFLLYKLTDKKSFKTDASNASRTMLMNLKDAQWDNDLLHLFEIKKSTLPEICDSFCHFGETKNLGILPDGIPITGILGDQQSALFGQAGFTKGEMKCTYGTGAFALFNTGEDLIYSKSGLLTTVAFKNKNQIIYALEGSSYIAGAAVGWLRDNLRLIKKSSEIEGMASEVKNMQEMHNVLFYPFFSGIGSPYWVSDAKATLTGLTRDTNANHIALACLEGIAFSINDLLRAIVDDTHHEIESLKVDGGAAANNLLMELQASISKTKIIRPQILETTAFGAALAAAVGLGMINFDEIKKVWKVDKNFSSTESKKSYIDQKQALWDQTLKKIYL